MAIQFPNSPSVGQVYEFGDYQYTFDGVKWTSVLKYGLAAAKISSETPPPSPEAGLMWYQPSTGLSFIWYEDEDSGQWVEENPSVGAVAHNLLDDRNLPGAHTSASITNEDESTVQDVVNIINEGSGISGTFTTNDGKTITVLNGIINSIV